MNHPLRPGLPYQYLGLPAQLAAVRRRLKLNSPPRWFEPLESRTMLSASISGQVFNDVNANGTLDTGETNIPGVTVFLDSNGDGQLDNGEISTVTDANGDYSITGLVAATYILRQALTGNMVASKPSTGFYNGPITADQVVTGIDFGDYTGGSISGQVFNDLNANGIAEPGEQGIPGAMVYFDTNNNNQIDAGEIATTTDANGNYTLNALPVGAGIVREILPAGFTNFLPSAAGASITITPGLTISGHNLGVYQTAAITGQVFTDFNGNGVKDSDDTGEQGVTLFLDTNGNGQLDAGELSTISDPNGNFGFTNLPAGTYNLREVQPADTLPSLPPGGVYSGPIAATDTGHNANFGNYPANTIMGEVYNDTNKNGAKNSGEVGVAGVTVFFDANNDGLLDNGEASTTTDAAGNYELPVTTPAHGSVRVVMSGGFVGSSPVGDSYAAALPAGQSLTGKDFGIYQAATAGSAAIVGHVFYDYNGNGVEDPGDAPASNDQIFYKDSTGTIVATVFTDAQGNYSFTGLAPGDYTVGQKLPVPALIFQTQPAQGDLHVTIADTTSIAYANFGDQSVGPNFSLAVSDVKLGSIDSPTVLIPGDTVTLTLKLTNTGDRTATGKIDLLVYASLGPAYNSSTDSHSELFEVAKRLSLGAGKSINYTVHVKIPPNLPPNTYYFSGIVQDVLGILETTTTDNTATSAAASTVALDFGTFTDHNKAKLVWLTSNNATLATASLKGDGAGQFIPNGDNTYELNITSALPTSSVTITTNSKSTAPLTLRDIQSNSGLTSFTAKTTDVVGDLTLPGGITTLALHSTSIGDTFSLAGPLGAFTAASIFGLNLDVTGSIGSITAVLWNSGVITADSIGSMKITGQHASKASAAVVGDLSASINLSTGVDTGVKLTFGSLTVAGTLEQSTITSAGNIGTIKLGAIVDSDIYAGVTTTESPDLPDAKADFADPNDPASIGSVTVLGLSPATPSFVRSRIAAAKIGTIKLMQIDTVGQAGSDFGIAGDTIALLSYIDANNAHITLANLTDPTDPRLMPYPIDNFDVVIAS